MTYLEELIDRYGRLKAEMDSYKKEVDGDNAEIKKLMTEENIENAKGMDYKATCKTIVSESFNEPKLLAKLKEMKIEGCIKTREYVDMEELESAIYNGEISATDIADCKEVKETLRLTVTKRK